MRKLTTTLLCTGALATLVSCGGTSGEQALIGAGAGVATAALLNGNLAAGALVGGAGNLVYCKQNPSKCN